MPMKTQLQNILLFSDLDDQIISQIESFTTEHKIAKEGLIFYEGDDSDYLYILTIGIIKLSKQLQTIKK